MTDWPLNEEKLSIRALAKKYKLNYTTFYKRITGQVKGYTHCSGGKGKSKILPKRDEGKLNH